MKILIIFLCLVFSITCQKSTSETITKPKSLVNSKKKNKNIKLSRATDYSSSNISKNDTIKTYFLKNKIYGEDKYKLVHMAFTNQEGEQIDLYKNKKKIKSIILPIPDIEVKNFQLDSIKETHKGFCLLTNNGGGNNLYIDRLYFDFYIENFYLYRQEKIIYDVEKDLTDTIVKKFNPKIKIDKIKLFEFYK